MRLRQLAAVTAAAAVLPTLALTAGPADAAAPRAAVKVSLRALPASVDVGRTITVAGTATPARKKGKRAPATLSVQRRYGAGAWRTVRTVRTTPSGRYAVKVPAAQGGTTSFRVRRAGGGTSPVRSLAVYAWLDLVDQPLLVGGNIIELRKVARIGGRSFPKSIELPGGNGGLAVSLAGRCTTFETWSGFLDAERAGLGADARQIVGVTTNGPAATPVSVPVGPAVRVTADLRNRSAMLLETTLQNASGVRAVLGHPRVRCNAASLPEVDIEDIGV